MIDIMTELRPIGELSKIGQYHVALEQLDALWDRISLPKEATQNSFLIVRYGISIATKAQQFDKAWDWANRGLPYSGNFNLGGESEFLAGEVAYVRGDFETAIKFFKIVKKISGWRLFKDKNPEYRRLLEV
jgi:hypothetical protein